MKTNPVSLPAELGPTSVVDVMQMARFVKGANRSEFNLPLLNALHIGVLCLQTNIPFEIYDEFGTLLIDSRLGRNQPAPKVVEILIALEALLIQDRERLLGAAREKNAP